MKPMDEAAAKLMEPTCDSPGSRVEANSRMSRGALGQPSRRDQMRFRRELSAHGATVRLPACGERAPNRSRRLGWWVVMVVGRRRCSPAPHEFQLASWVARATNVRTAAPVPPSGVQPYGDSSFHAGPAMSRCAQEIPSGMKCCRKAAAVRAPP